MAISYNRLGSNGRLGNQMFQYSGFRGIASHKGYDWLIPPEDADSTCNYGLFDCFKMTNVSADNKGFGLSNWRTIETGLFHFDENLFNTCPDDVNLNNYFQTEKYFKHIEDEIREDFTFSKEITEMCKELYNSIIDGESISLHIRRGDYTVNPNHPTQTVEYYDKALSKFDSKIPVFVFSDDPSWCHEQELFSDDRFMISDDNTTEFDLCLMSLCTYHIIANSSFSWWGAWLAKSQKIIAPKNWFAAECGNKSIQDVPFGDFTFL